MNRISEPLLTPQSVTNLPAETNLMLANSNAITRAKRRSRNRAAKSLLSVAFALLTCAMLIGAGYVYGVHQTTDYFQELFDAR